MYQWLRLRGLARSTYWLEANAEFINTHIRVTWLITLGGGGEDRSWVLGTSFYKGVKFERGENLSHKTQVFHFLFSVSFLIAIIQVSNKKNYSYAENIGGAFVPPLPAQVTPRSTSMRPWQPTSA
jgi:hypothetical protein